MYSYTFMLIVTCISVTVSSQHPFVNDLIH